MTVSVELVELQKNGVANGVAVDCAMQCYEPTWIELYYGTSKVKAVYNTDYTVSLAPDYLSFTFTPTASLITKITNLGEGNVTFVVRKPDVIQDFDTTDAFTRQRIVDMIDKAYMNLQHMRWYMYGVVADIGFPSWGDIGGSLAAQTDLQAALDGKVNTSVLTESVQDIVGAFLSGSGITATYTDVSNTLVLTIDNSAIGTNKIADGAVTSAKIADGTIATGDIADGAITSAKIADGTIATGDIADNAITTAKITDANVTTGKLADNAVTNAKLATMAANTVKMNNTAGVAAPTDVGVSTLKTALAIVPGDISGFNESVQDVIGASFANTSTVTWAYDDGAGTFAASVAAAVLARLLPAGGTTGQSLVKVDGTDYNVQWSTVSGGGGGSGDMDKATYDTDNDGKVDHAELADVAPWSGLTGVPSTFTPSSHSHAQSDVTGLVSDISTLYTSLAGKAATSHTHAQSDITNLVSDLSTINTSLSGKAASSHTHTAANITDFSEAVDDRVAALLVQGTNITLTYNDAGNALTIAAASGSAPEWIKQGSDYTLTSQTAQQKIFNATTNGRLTLATGQYRFELMLYVTTMSATSGNFAFSVKGAGTAVIDEVLYQGNGNDNSNPLATSANQGGMWNADVSGANVIVAATGTGMRLEITGTFRVTTGGTIIPSLGLVTANAAIVKAGSYMTVERLGASADHASVGFD